MSTQHFPREFQNARPISAEEALGGADLAALWSAAMTNIKRFSAIVASRPNFKPERSTACVLSVPQCEHECGKCYLSCAVAPALIKRWEDELAQSCGSAQMGRA